MGNKNGAAIEEQKTRSRISQTEVPAHSLAQALRIPKAIRENYAGEPTTPLRVASAMSMQPNSGTFRTMCGAAVAYGLTEGGYTAPEIKLTPLGRRIVRPTEEGDDGAAMREALLQPRVVREFLTKYNGNGIPKDEIAWAVLEDMGVPLDRTPDVLSLILDGAESLGLISEIKGRRYLDLGGPTTSGNSATHENGDGNENHAGRDGLPSAAAPAIDEVPNIVANDAPTPAVNRRVFITHGRNRGFVGPIKKLLLFGELEPVVSVEKQSVSQPVPDKVMEDMRKCGAAIIHVEDELRLVDSEAREHPVLNPNVLIEIGAAMALFGRRFILLVQDGVKLPSNLQGLFEVRYDGRGLDGTATIKLLEAINEMKKRPLGNPSA